MVLALAGVLLSWVLKVLLAVAVPFPETEAN